MKFRLVAVAALALLLPFGAIACSDDSTGDLSVSEMSSELQKNGLPEQQADCIAKALKQADFTKDDLEAMGKSDAKNLDTNSGKFKEYVDAASKCISAGIPTTSAP